MRLQILTTLTFLLLPLLVKAQLDVSSDNNMALHTAGEPMNFIVVSNSSGEVEYSIKYHDHVPVIASGTILVEEDEPAYIPFTSATPALVICEVQKGNKKDEVAAVFSPYEITALAEEPADFDAFWNSQKALLAAVDINPQIEYHDDSDYETTYRLRLDNIDGKKVYGYISVPVGIGPFPAVLTLPPYGDAANLVSPSEHLAERGGAISVTISVHDTPVDEHVSDAYEPDDYTNKESYYYRHSLLGALRAIDYIFSRDDFDGQSLAVNGVSQGGGLSTIVAGLDDRVKLLVQSNGTMGQHGGNAFDRASGFPYYIQKAISDDNDVQATVDASRYYDAIFHAKRFKGTSLSIIGYEDEICPAATGFAFYNQFRGPKILMHGLDLEHSHPDEYWSGRFDLYRRHFPAMQTPPWPWPDTEIGYAIDAGSDQIVSDGCSINLSGEIFLENEMMDDWPVQWTQIEGPGVANIEDPGNYNTAVTFDQEGTYVLRFSGNDLSMLADDNQYFTLTDYVQITVNSAGGSAPDVVLSTNATNSDAPFEVEVVFDQSVSGLELSDFVIINGTASGLSGSSNVYTITVTPTAAGPVEISLPAGATTNCNNLSNSASNNLIVQYDPPSGILELDCPENILIFVANGNGYAEVNWDNPLPSSTCPGGQVVLNQIGGLPNGSDFPVGTSIVSYEATDQCGNVLTCNFEIVIEEENVISEPDCYSQSEISSLEYISKIVFGAIDNPSGNSVYSDFTEQMTSLEKGSLSPFELTLLYTSNVREDQYIKVWIDFNLDAVFDEATETVLSTSFEGNSNIEQFTIPAQLQIPLDASTGVARMRVAMKRGSYPAPCESFEYGEVEDYAIMIEGEANSVISQSCPKDIYKTAAPGNAAAFAAWNNIGGFSNCSNPVVVITQVSGPPSGSVFPIGITEIVYSIEDLCGSIAYCSFNVVVEPANPVLSIDCPDDIVSDMPPAGIVSWAEPAVFSNCAAGSVNVAQVAGPPNGGIFPVGSSLIVYTASDDCGNARTCNFTVSVSGAASDYCNSQSSIPWDDWISNVEFGSISNPSGKSTYSDFSNAATEVIIGESYPIDLTCSFDYENYNEFWRVWIDFNQDEVFDDATETVFYGSTTADVDGTPTATLSGNITIPDNASLGLTRMRISKKRGSYPSPCDYFAFGEVEDYSVQIMPLLQSPDTEADPYDQTFSDDFSEKNISLYPNPVDDLLTIDLSRLQFNNSRLEVLDVNGQKLLTRSLSVTEPFLKLNCRDWAQGLYLIRLTSTDQQVVVKRFVKS